MFLLSVPFLYLFIVVDNIGAIFTTRKKLYNFHK